MRPLRASRSQLLASLLAVCALVLSACSERAPQDVLEPEGPRSLKVDQLWDLTFGIAAAIFFIVEGLLVFALIKFRHREGREPAQFHGNTKLEVLLTIIPALILAGVAIPTVRTLFQITADPAGENVIRVNLVAKQFWWEYRYEPPIGVVTANELHIPTDTLVQLEMHGATDDVIHSFWVPKLAGTQDVVPGRVTDLTLLAAEPGTYYGQCKEYCGLSHANMRIRVIAQTPEDFQAWVTQQQQPAEVPGAGLAAEGFDLFLNGPEGGAFPGGPPCATCHAIEGTDAQGVVGPDLTHFASRETFAGAFLQNNEANLRSWLEDPPARKPGVRMPDLGLNSQQINALMAFLQTLE